MDRSPGFGSTPCDYFALFRLGFPTPPLSVKLATKSKSLTHYTKGTQSHDKSMLPLLVRTRFQVLFHSPHRGSFRLSLTVLVHYRSMSSI